MSEIEKVSNLLDEAWKRLKEEPNAENEAAYDAAYEKWKGLSVSPNASRPAGYYGNWFHFHPPMFFKAILHCISSRQYT
jgi:hypothetical protein